MLARLLAVSRRRHPRSYAQSGEDMLARFALQQMGIIQPSYLDLGAYHPTKFSNTYLFYREGACGVCVEPDPKLCARIKRRRRRDTCIAAAVGAEDGIAELQLMNAPTLSTLSRDTAKDYESQGEMHRGSIQVPVLKPATIIERHCRTVPNLVSLDVEGLDLAVLEAWDFVRYRPELFIVETIAYAGSVKIPEIPALMESVGYDVYGDTHINTVFVRR